MYLGSWFINWASWAGINCPAASGGADACFSSSGLVRISWSLMIFQFLIFLVTLMRNNTAAVIHDGWWTLKFLIVAALFVSSMWIPNTFMVGYMKFARVFSVIFLSYQAMLVLVLSYLINKSIVDKVSEGSGLSTVSLIALFLIFTVGNIVWIVY
jgi:hypothetical protein